MSTLPAENAINDIRIVSTDCVVGLSLVHQGIYSYICHMPTSGHPVSFRTFSKEMAVKVFRVSDDGQEGLPSLLLSRYKSHPAAFVHKHITSFVFIDVHELSMAQGTRSTKAMVTTWYSQGNVLTYLKRHPAASTISLAVQASKALEHLHTFGIVHGNIYPGNIFVTDEGHATITDISVYTLASGQFPFHQSLQLPQPHSVYQSPELLLVVSDACMARTTAMDVYSFGLTTFAMFTGRAPSIGENLETLGLPVREGLPERLRENGLSTELLQLLQWCCVYDPEARPSMSQVVEKLEYIEIYHTFDSSV